MVRRLGISTQGGYLESSMIFSSMVLVFGTNYLLKKEKLTTTITLKMYKKERPIDIIYKLNIQHTPLF